MTEKAKAFIENLTKDPKTMKVAMEFGQKALAFGAEKSDFIREKVLPLAKNMGIDKSTIARQVEALEAQDFVSRRPSQKDKRVLCVYPTEKMSEFLPGLDAAMQTWEQELLQELTETECQQLYAILAKLRLRVDPEV